MGDLISSAVGAVSGIFGGGLGSAINVGANALGAYSGYQQMQQAPQLAQMSDPFGSSRGQYAGMLQNLMTGATPITASPGYQFAFGQGLEALNRTEAAKGMLGSGNRLQDLMTYGQGMGQSEYSNQVNRLSRLAGADIGGGASAATILADQTQAGLGNLGAGLRGLAGTIPSTPTQTSDTNMTGFMTNPFGPSSGPYSNLWK